MIRAQSLQFTYPQAERPALSGVDLDLPPGQVLGVVGASGAGKTSLCMMLAGLVPRATGGVSTGALEVGGVDPRRSDAADLARRVNLVFEDYAAQLTQITVLGEVMAPLTNSGTPAGEARSRARQLLEELGLGDLDAEHKRTWELSGGQQQRVAIAAALACAPDVLILDNVTGLLDPVGKESVRRLVADLSAEMTLVVVEHDLDLLVGVADHLLVLEDGRAVAHGPAAQLLSRAQLLQDAQLEPPTVVQIARHAALDPGPLTVAELASVLGPVASARPHRGSEDPLPLPAAPAGPPAVDAHQVSLSYPDGTLGLDNVCLSIPPAQVHAVVGGNGAGKSTLLRMFCGLAAPTSGTVTVGGRDTRGHSPADLAWSVGTALQNPDEQITERTVRAEIEHPMRLRSRRRRGLRRQTVFSDDEIRAAGEQARALVGLPVSLMEADPTHLSRGHRKLVAIAAALVMDPAVLLLDEPAVSLDAPARAVVRDVLRKLRDRGTTVVLVEHDLALVAETADQVTLLDRGRHLLTGRPEEVFAVDRAEAVEQASLLPPRAARVAAELGLDGLTVDEVAAQIAPIPQEA